MTNKSVAKISAAIQFIETHLMEKMDLNRVATAVHYSKYHLHRVFASMVGLTIHDYVQRRRLTEAAWLLFFFRLNQLLTQRFILSKEVTDDK